MYGIDYALIANAKFRNHMYTVIIQAKIYIERGRFSLTVSSHTHTHTHVTVINLTHVVTL